MAAYVVLEIDVKDPRAYEGYKGRAAATVAAFGGRYLVRGAPCETLEGTWSPSRLVILEFPSVARAREWWDSEAYRPIRKLRHESAETEMVVVAGVEA